jgi:hypothetical protein
MRDDEGACLDIQIKVLNGTVCFTESGKLICSWFDFKLKPLFAILPQQPLKTMLAIKVVKIDSKIIILLP